MKIPISQNVAESSVVIVSHFSAIAGIWAVPVQAAGHGALLALMLLSTGELILPNSRRRKAWLPRVSESQGLHVCQALTTMVISGIIAGRSLVLAEGTAHELLLFQLMCSFLAPLFSRCLDPDRAKTDDSPSLVALTRLSDAATLLTVAGFALQSTWHLPRAVLFAGIASFTTATALLHQGVLRQLPKTFTEGEAWLCATLAANSALWLATTAVAPLPITTSTGAAAALARLMHLDTLPVVIALSTALFCCSAAPPLRAAVRQWTADSPTPCISSASDKEKRCKDAVDPASASNGGISPWPAPTGGGRAGCPVEPLAAPPRAGVPAGPPQHCRTALRPSAPALLLIATSTYAVVIGACALATLRYVFAAPHRMATVVLWALALAATVPSMLAIARTGRVPHHILRKGFHLLSLVLFIPVLLLDPPLLSLALAVAFVLLALAELVRTADVPRVSAALTGPMTRFTDARDEGSFLVSHLSLLLGIAVPIWVSLAGGGPVHPAPLTAWTGLIVLGLSDTAAATVGSLCGRLKVHTTSKKTAEGLLAAAVVTLVSLGGVAWWQGHAQGAMWWLQLAWYSLLACMLEAVTLQLDNLVFAWHAFALLSLLR